MGTTRRKSFRAFNLLGSLSSAVTVALAVVMVAGCEPDPLSPGAEVNFAETNGGGGQVLIGAGDIASCTSTGDEATAALVDSLLVEYPDAVVFTAGDNVYQDGTAQEYTQCYQPSWGRFKDRTWATIGNHEYGLGNADPTFDYFGERLGPRDLGYYSLDVGNWHLVMLNSNGSFVPLDLGSPQNEWLRADLSATTKSCVMAVFHHPRFHSCTGPGCSLESSGTKPFWDALYEYGADVVVNGHFHHYERFAPQDPDGNSDPDSGIREFIVGTGGTSVGIRDTQAPNSEVLNDERSYGVIKFTLHDDKSYEWEFIPVPGYNFTDSGSGTCSGAGPIADFTWAATDRTVDFTDTSSDADGTVVAWSWAFGDGATSTLRNPSHTYAAVGTYTVTLTVTDNDGLTGTTTRSVPAGPHAPTADFTWAATELTVDFTDTSSDADDTVEGWNWDFGDGNTSTLQNPSHTYAVDGSYAVTLTVRDNAGLTGTTTQTVRVASRTGDIVYVTSTGSGTVGSVSFADEDILAYDSDTDTWSLYFDGSDVGLDGTNDRDVRAFELLSNGDILLSLYGATTLPDVGNVDPSDIVRFSGSTGANTSGTFSLYLRGADVGLTGEAIDAIGFAPDGRLVISTSGSFSVPGASGGDEDLIALDAGSARWSLYFDGSDVGLNDSSDEDVAGLWIDAITGDIYLSTRGAFSVPGVSGNSSTVFVCEPLALGSTTSCSYASYWEGSLHGLTSNDLLGIDIGKASAPANVPPTANINYSCIDLDCDFADASSDPDGTVVGWSWNFGDGMNSTARDPWHQYAAAGSYTVTLTVTDDDGATSPVTTQTVSVTAAPPPPNQAPTASFTWSATNLTVAFTDASSDADGTVVAWSWNFGDGATSTQQSPSHSYAAAGSYTVTLTVTDDDGATSPATQTVTVTAAPPPPNQSPTASFSWAATNLTVAFTDASSDADGTVVAWSWNFGDGATSTQQSPSHTYAAAGSYTVTLTVTDDDGATSPATQTVTVTAAPTNQLPTASFKPSCTDLVCSFNNTSSDPDGTLVAWHWDFGDGTSSTEQSPSHTYAAVRSYTVTLTVTDDAGATAQSTETVSVLTVSASSPNTMAAGSSINVTITGSGFASGATLALEGGTGPAPTASNVVWVNANTITAMLTMKSGGPSRDRLWNVRVTNPDGSSGVLAGGLTVTNSR